MLSKRLCQKNLPKDLHLLASNFKILSEEVCAFKIFLKSINLIIKNFVNLRYHLVCLHLYPCSKGGVIQLIPSKCVCFQNFYQSYQKAYLFNLVSVSTYICSVRGVIQLNRSKCVRFRDFSQVY